VFCGESQQEFSPTILPRLGTAPLSEIMEAAGCSRRPRPTTDGGSGRRMFRRGGRSASWLASAFEDTSQHKRGVLSLSTGPAALPTPTSTRG
jgi:hypothetical protein